MFWQGSCVIEGVENFQCLETLLKLFFQDLETNLLKIFLLPDFGQRRIAARILPGKSRQASENPQESALLIVWLGRQQLRTEKLIADRRTAELKRTARFR